MQTPSFKKNIWNTVCDNFLLATDNNNAIVPTLCWRGLGHVPTNYTIFSRSGDRTVRVSLRHGGTKHTRIAQKLLHNRPAACNLRPASTYLVTACLQIASRMCVPGRRQNAKKKKKANGFDLLLLYDCWLRSIHHPLAYST